MDLCYQYELDRFEPDTATASVSKQTIFQSVKSISPEYEFKVQTSPRVMLTPPPEDMKANNMRT